MFRFGGVDGFIVPDFEQHFLQIEFLTHHATPACPGAEAYAGRQFRSLWRGCCALLFIGLKASPVDDSWLWGVILPRRGRRRSTQKSPLAGRVTCGVATFAHDGIDSRSADEESGARLRHLPGRHQDMIRETRRTSASKFYADDTREQPEHGETCCKYWLEVARYRPGKICNILNLNVLQEWRPQRDSNPCYQDENLFHGFWTVVGFSIFRNEYHHNLQ